MVDEGNAGTVIVEDLENAGYDVIGINFTTHKANMVRLLANDLERGRAQILGDAEYGLVEFENYEMNTTPGGRYTYAAPIGQHDDVVSAKMLSHWGVVNEGTANVTLIDPGDAPEAPPRRERPTVDNIDAWGDQEDYDDYSDLIDEDLNDPRAAAEAIGYVTYDLTRPPTATELLLRDDVWN